MLSPKQNPPPASVVTKTQCSDFKPTKIVDEEGKTMTRRADLQKIADDASAWVEDGRFGGYQPPDPSDKFAQPDTASRGIGSRDLKKFLLRPDADSLRDIERIDPKLAAELKARDASTKRKFN